MAPEGIYLKEMLRISIESYVNINRADESWFFIKINRLTDPCINVQYAVNKAYEMLKFALTRRLFYRILKAMKP